MTLITKSELDKLDKKEKILREAAKILSVDEKDLPRVIDRFLKEISEMKKSS